MLLASPEEVRVAEAISRLTTGNPFVSERIDLERKLLGAAFVPTGSVWNLRTSLDGDRPNLAALTALAERWARTLETRLHRGERPDVAERPLVRGIILHHLYYKYRDRLRALLDAGRGAESASGPVTFFAEFVADLARLSPRTGPPLFESPEHVFACVFQTLRAFVNIYTHLVGGSAPIARLRADVWRSIFTRAPERYMDGLYRRMPDVTTLVLGPTGTGKELVARAIAHSGYLAFEPRARRFVSPPGTTFMAVNLAALSSTLIEAELFGHRRGSFTGALADRHGFLEECAAGGAIFLDEIGDLEAALQVKLLRVLQDRTFQRIGETKARRFVGKIVAATNRDLEVEMNAGRFRADFYYRLCADLIATPSLAAQLTDSPGDLPNLIRFISERVATPDLAPDLATEVSTFIAANLPADYPWPGNFRELEQCVRNVMVRGHYRPQTRPARTIADELADGVRDATLSADQVFGRYAALVFHRAGSLREAARRLGTDSRTVKARIDRAFLRKLQDQP